MIKKRLLILFLLHLYFGADSLAQEIKWAVHINKGVSQIVFLDLDKESTLFYEKRLKNQFRLTWNYGSSCSVKIDKDVDLEIGLSILSIKGKFVYKLENPNGPNQFINVKNLAQTFYLGVPINLNFRLNKFIFASGFKTLIFVRGDYKNSTHRGSELSGPPLYLKRQGDFNFRRFDLGLNFGLKYKFCNSFSINTNCYWGLSNMFANPSPSGTGFSRRNRYLTLGMSHYIQD